MRHLGKSYYRLMYTNYNLLCLNMAEYRYCSVLMKVFHREFEEYLSYSLGPDIKSQADG
jgi:hypothetical protein